MYMEIFSRLEAMKSRDLLQLRTRNSVPKKVAGTGMFSGGGFSIIKMI